MDPLILVLIMLMFANILDIVNDTSNNSNSDTMNPQMILIRIPRLQ